MDIQNLKRRIEKTNFGIFKKYFFFLFEKFSTNKIKCLYH
jgi:hypothetical protein